MALLNSLELMQQHVKALYIHDERQRIMAINQWDGGTVPRFYLGRTPVAKVWRFRADLPDDLVSKLTALCLEESADVLEEPQHKNRYLQLLASHEAVQQLWRGPVYSCSQAIKPAVLPIAITKTNAHLLEGGLEAWLPDIAYRQPFMAAVADAKAVAICASVRITDTAHEAGVETLSKYRQQGHAANAVAGWVQALLAKKVIPLYSTSWDNIASQNLAKRVGFTLFGSDFHIT